jgi:predicted metal-binding protein
MPLATAGKAGGRGGSPVSASRETCQRMKETGGRGVPRPGEGASAPSLAAAPFVIGQVTMVATLYVCTTCKAGAPVPEGSQPPGADLYSALSAAGAPEGVRIVGVECLSACNTGCAISLAKPGAWSYVYGRLTLDDVPAILEGAGKYAATSDGIVPWRDRPTVFRKQSIARIPPLPPQEAAE